MKEQIQMKKNSLKNKVFLKYFLTLVLFVTIIQNQLNCEKPFHETPFEIAKKYANTVCRYDMLKDFNKHIFNQKYSGNNSKNYDSIAMFYRILILNSTLDIGFTFNEIQFDITTKSNLNYFEFTDFKTGFLSKRYFIAVDSTYIIYKLANFNKNDLDIFYNFELERDSLNYLKFIKLYYNDKLIDQYNNTDICYKGIDSIDKVKAKFDYPYQITYVDKTSYIHINGNITTLIPNKKELRYRLYQYDFKFFEDRFEENCLLIKEEIHNR